MTADSRSTGSPADPETDVSETTAGDLRNGDVVRVETADDTVERAEVIARWKFNQEDFSHDTADSVPVETRRWTDHTGDEDVEKSEKRKRGTGDRSTIITPNGTKYAVVNWIANNEPAHLYLLVVDAADPEDRRWTDIGAVQSIGRYGAEPKYRMKPLKWGLNMDRDHHVLKAAADGEFSDTSVELPDASKLRNMANTRRADETLPLTRRELSVIGRCYDAAREHVEQTDEPLIKDTVEDDLEELDRTPEPQYYMAVFPDGDGGDVRRKRPNSGPPSEDIPPWEQEQNADPEFTPLGHD